MCECTTAYANECVSAQQLIVVEVLIRAALEGEGVFNKQVPGFQQLRLVLLELYRALCVVDD